MKNFLLTFLLLAPSIASAIGGSFTISGVIENYYTDNINHVSKPLYTIKATKRIRRVDDNNPYSIRSLINEQIAEKRLQYKKGRITFGHNYINFDTAYFFRGNLILKQAQGKLSGKLFSSIKVIYKPIDHLITSERIFLIGQKSISAKTDFIHKLTPSLE